MKSRRNCRSLIALATLATVFAPSVTNAMDLPRRHRAPVFQGFPKTNLRDWNTEVELSYLEGKTDSSRNSKEQKTSLFNAHGPFDLTLLAENVENITQECTPLTYQFLRIVKGLDADNNIEVKERGSFAALGVDSTTGLFKFFGDFYTDQLDVTLHQNLVWGFYAHLYLPFMKARLQCIHFKHCGEQPKTQEDQDVFDDFLENLDAILAEHCIKPLACDFDTGGLGDAVVSVGWQGYDNTSYDVITSIQGNVQLGLLLPTGHRVSNNRVFAVPLGYDDLWAVHGRATLQGNLWRFIGIGLQGAVSIFFKDTL